MRGIGDAIHLIGTTLPTFMSGEVERRVVYIYRGREVGKKGSKWKAP